MVWGLNHARGERQFFLILYINIHGHAPDFVQPFGGSHYNSNASFSAMVEFKCYLHWTEVWEIDAAFGGLKFFMPFSTKTNLTGVIAHSKGPIYF